MQISIKTIVGLILLAGSTMLNAADATLKAGDPAPKLQTGDWVQGEPVKKFENGKAYIVEFWATWCGPCRATIPHLNDLHKKFADKGLIVIGQNVWERDETLVRPFLKKMGSNMTYRVVLDDKSKDEKGAMAVNWMQAAQRNGIPAAFLVDKQGRIAWIGHPSSLQDETIEQVLAGKFDLKKAAEKAELEQKNNDALMKQARALGEQMEAKDWAAAEKTVDEISNLMPEESRAALDSVRIQICLGKADYAAAATAAERLSRNAKSAPMLNQIAWQLVTSKDSSKPEVVNIAHGVATRANELAKDKDPAILDTLARATWMKGEKKKAIELQEKAVSLAGDDKLKASLQKALSSYKQGKLPTADE